MTRWWSAARQVLALEWLLCRRPRKLMAAWIGRPFVPALSVLICLSAAWDPAAHKGALAVEPVLEIVAPVANDGSALVPNFVPVAL